MPAFEVTAIWLSRMRQGEVSPEPLS